MNTCLKCGAQMPDNAMFCLKCGFADIKHCTKCGKERVPGSLFCRSCGKRYYTPKDIDSDSLPVRKVDTKSDDKKTTVSNDAVPEAVLPVQSADEMVDTTEVISESPFVETDEQQLEIEKNDASEINIATEAEFSENNESDNISEFHSFSEPNLSTAPVVDDSSVADNANEKKKSPLIFFIGIGILVLIIASFSAIYLLSTASQRKYKQAKKAYEAGDYEKAASYFDSIGDFQDSKTLAEEAKSLFHYENGRKAFDSKDYAKAVEEFTAAGNCKDAEAMVREAVLAGFYSKGVELSDSGDYLAALDEFSKASDYKDTQEQIKKCYYQLGEAAFAKNDFDEAEKYFNLANDYNNATAKIPEINYKRGEVAFDSGDMLKAAGCFNLAGKFKDAEERAKDLYYTLAVDTYNKKEYEKAANYFSIIGDYKDSAVYSPDAYYNGAIAYLNDKDYENAGKYLGLAGKYKDANKIMIRTIQKLVKAEEFENARKLCLQYSADDTYQWSKYIDGMIAFKEQNFESAAAFFKDAGDFLNSNECYLSSNYNQGLLYLKDKSFSQARPFFVLGGSYKFSKDLVNVCDAETKYAEGAISQASKLYAKVSKKTKITEFDVQGRKAHVNARLTLENVKGNWSAKTNTIFVKHTESEGYSHQWNASYVWEGQYITLSFTQNTNGTFNITVEVTFGAYTNYSYYSYDLNHELKTYKKTYKNQKQLPTSMKLDNNATLKYSSGAFKVVYSKYVKSGSATNQFGSTVTYKKGT